MRYLHITSPTRAEDELKRVGVDWPGIEAMIPKMETVNLLLEGIECRVANILKQEMLSIGGDVAVARESVACSIDRTDAILIGKCHVIVIGQQITLCSGSDFSKNFTHGYSFLIYMKEIVTI